MTTDQQLAFVRSFYESVRSTKHKEMQLHFLARARGAADAFFATFTISHPQYNELVAEIETMTKEIVE